MAGGSHTTGTPGLARRLGQYSIDNITLQLECAPEFQVHIPKRWFVGECFDLHAYDPERKRFRGAHLEVRVSDGVVRNYTGRMPMSLLSIAITIELYQFAKEVLIAAR